MYLSRRPKLGLSVAVVAAVAAVVGALAAPAQAFQIQNHEKVTREALTPLGVDQTAMAQILVGPPPGGGAVGSDAFFFDEFRHIDNAPNPVEICNRTQQAWNFFTPIIINGARPAGPGGSDLVDGPGARAAFGGLAHAVQDFYAHTNWVEDNIAIGQLDRMPPSLMPTCDPGTLPADLHSGFFALGADHDDALAGCPPGGPPPGFADCHSTLNKDDWSTPRGGIQIPGTNPPINYFDLAMQLSNRATVDLYNQIRGLISADAGACAADNLFQADRHQACW
jgi:hypothetical protein